MAEPKGQSPVELISEDDIRLRVEAMADNIAPHVSNDTVAVCLLTGGLWFAADLTRALARRGKHLLFDALWLASYGDAKESTGRIEVRAALQRPVAGRDVLIIDDVLDSGLSLAEAVAVVKRAGAARVRTAVFARKPWPISRAIAPDFVGWEAPARFLVGYGLDAAGRLRGLPGIAALD